MTYNESSVLITGASRGIGRSIAITFAASIRRPLILVARNEEMLRETAALCEKAGTSEVLVLACDASDSHSTEALEIPESFPKPGVIINNAGSYLYKTLSKTSEQEFKNQIDLNLFTAVNMVNRFRDHLLTLDRALIVNICSVGAIHGLGDSGAYSAAKHALLGYTRSLREELKDTAVGVTAVNLGQTHSTSWDESDMSPEKLINPTDVAMLIAEFTRLSPRSLVEEIIIQPQNGRVAPM